MRHGAIDSGVVDQTSHLAELLEPVDLDGAVVTSGALRRGIYVRRLQAGRCGDHYKGIFHCWLAPPVQV
jgi:hypothetical protein